MRNGWRIAVLIVVMAGSVLPAHAWGFYGHKRINHMAALTLPTELIGFYKYHLSFVTEHAVDPDKRRYGVKAEAPRHYIDIDHYDHDHPFEAMPRAWKDAVAKYGEDTLKAYGIVPWHIQSVLHWLTEAFREKNLDRILQLSADLGHYVADAHVPLHTTENYNGQLTNQVGIHGLWESRLPELMAEGYDYFVGPAVYLEAPLDAAWQAVEASHTALDSVLSIEAALTRQFPQDQKYAFEQAGARNARKYSEAYSKAYHQELNGMVERRMRAAIIAVGSYWYTAWVNAGKPDLGTLSGKPVSEALKKQIAEEELQYQQGTIKGRHHDE